MFSFFLFFLFMEKYKIKYNNELGFYCYVFESVTTTAHTHIFLLFNYRGELVL